MVDPAPNTPQPKPQAKFWRILSPFTHLVAGAMGAVLALAVVLPDRGIVPGGIIPGGIAASTPGDDPEMPTSVEAMLDDTLAATLVLRKTGGDGFLGSAFLWAGGTKAVTNAHVLKGADQVDVITQAGERITAQVLRRDDDRDIALLSLPRTLGPGLTPLKGQSAPKPGTWIFALGAPLETSFTVTWGIISTSERQVLPSVPLRFIQHDAAINPGSSGGPLVNGAGQLVGMNTRIADGSRYYVGISYAIPAHVISQFVNGTLPPLPKLGIALRPVSKSISTALGMPDQGGLLLDNVAANSLAEAAGLRAGDVITTLDETPLKSAGDLAFALGQARGEAEVSVKRDDQDLTMVLALATPQGPKTASLAPPLSQGDQTDPKALAAARLAAARLAAQSQTATTGQTSLTALGITMDANGQVTELDETQAAYAGGMTLGDQILAINGAAPKADIPLPAVIRVQREDRQMHIVIDPGTRRFIRPLGGGNTLDPDVSLF